MGAPTPPPRPAPSPELTRRAAASGGHVQDDRLYLEHHYDPTAPKPVAKTAPTQDQPISQSTEERQKRASNKRSGRTSLIVNRGGAQGLGGGDDNMSIKKRTLG